MTRWEPTDVDRESAMANCRDGILELVPPKGEETRTREIPIQG